MDLKTLRVLLIEDSPSDARLVREALGRHRAGRFEVEHAELLSEGLSRLAQGGIEILLLDLSLPDSSGFVTFEEAFAAAGEVPILVLTGLDDEELAARAMRAGAQDYLPKDELVSGLLPRSIRHAIERKQAERELARSNRELQSFRRISELVLTREPFESKLGLMLDEICEASGFHLGWIELEAEGASGLRCVARRGFGGWEPPAESPSTQVLAVGEVSVETEAARQPEALQRLGVRATVRVPMKSESRAFGVLGLGRSDGVVVDDRCLRWIEALAGHIAALVESQRAAERLHFQADVLAHVQDSVIVTNRDGRILYWNKGAIRIFGYTAEEALGQTPASLYFDVSEGAEDLRESLTTIQEGGGRRYTEWRGRRKDGSEVWVDVDLAPWRHPDGTPMGIVGVAKEVTERRQAMVAQERLTAILEAATDFIGIADTEGKVVYMNQAGRQMVGAAPDADLVGTPIDLYSPEWATRAFFEVCFPSAIRDGVWTGRSAFLGPDGREVPVWQVIVAHKRPDGSVERFSTIARDITERLRAEEELRALNETLKAMVEASPLSIVTFDAESQVTLWSPAAERTFGWKAEEILGKTLPIVPEDRLDEHLALRGGVLDGRLFTGVETRRQDRAGRSLDLRISAAPLRDAHGRICGIAEFLEDINDRKRAESAIRRLASVPEQSPDPLIELDLAGNALYVNQAARSCFPDLQALGSWHPVLENLAGILARFRHGERKSFSFEVSHDQKIYNQMVYYMPDGSLVRVFLHDITEQRKAREILERESLHDRLTGLPNRTLFLRRLEEHIQQGPHGPGGGCAVLSLNLDRFKVINETLGQAAGDQLLSSVAGRIAACLSPKDIVARLSSDEFAVLAHPGPGESLALAERIRESVAQPLEVARQDVFPSASVGIAACEGYEDGEMVLRDAHIAMYRAKTLGGGRCEVFERAMGSRSLERLRLENELRRAFERGDLRMYYQPIVRLSDGAIVGFESLMRWPRPDRGMVPPSEFIPIAEETGLILQLSYWALTEVCQRVSEWTGPAVHLNISSRVFADPLFYPRLRSALAESSVPGERLVLEITESVLMGEPEAAAETLRRIKSLGVGLALDDFGTGYSSLSYLQQFPIDSLKIDRSFISRIGSRKQTPEVLEAILTLAQRLGMEVIAEGVETEDQLAQLSFLGCNFAQGYLFSRAVDREAVRPLLERPAWAGRLGLGPLVPGDPGEAGSIQGAAGFS